MDHILHNIGFIQDTVFLKGFVFGLMHCGIMVIGFYTGFSLNRLLKIISNGFIAGIFGVIIAHVVADLIASLMDPDIRPMTVGIVVGGLVPLIFIPFFDKYITKSKYHILVGDHEEIKQDLKDKHK